MAEGDREIAFDGSEQHHPQAEVEASEADAVVAAPTVEDVRQQEDAHGLQGNFEGQEVEAEPDSKGGRKKGQGNIIFAPVSGLFDRGRNSHNTIQDGEDHIRELDAAFKPAAPKKAQKKV
jgi:hypothetical protein